MNYYYHHYISDNHTGERGCMPQDKGGPSKGGFLNNILLSYTDLYSCNETNGMCI